MSKVMCDRCKQVISSNHIHEMVWCECGHIALDGGDDYMKISSVDGATCTEITQKYFDDIKIEYIIFLPHYFDVEVVVSNRRQKPIKEQLFETVVYEFTGKINKQGYEYKFIRGM